MKVYHYTHMSDWYDIQKGSYKSNYVSGLGSFRRIGTADMEAWKTTAVFALLDPLPDIWRRNRIFPNTWQHLKSNIGDLLLELDIKPGEDEAYVVDWAHMESFLEESKKGIPREYQHKTRADAERAYFGSRVSIEEYTRRSRKLKYQLPEVIIINNIPLDRIHISRKQPFLEEKLNGSWKKIYLEELQREAPRIPELVDWCQGHHYDIGRSEDGLGMSIRGER